MNAAQVSVGNSIGVYAFSLLISVLIPNYIGDGRVVRWCWVNFQCRASYNLDDSRARAYCACSRCGWDLFGHFYSHLSLFSSFSLPLGDGSI